MILADTSIWIEFLKGNDPIFKVFKGKLEHQEILAFECVFGELLQGARDERERDVIMSYWKYLPKAEEPGVWIEAGLYSGKNKLLSQGVGLIDAVLLIITRRARAQIWTLDKKLQRLFDPDEIFRKESEPGH